MTFKSKRGTTRRALKPNLIIWHWTGGENSAQTTYHTLINRNLGVAFCIDRQGVIYQFLDPVLYDPKDTGGRMGRRSISIEVANYGFRARGQRIPTRGRDRATDEERIHGVKVSCARFYPQQVESIAALTKVLCAELEIPLVFPREPTGQVAFRELDSEEKYVFRGVIGHFHKTDHKYDPGFQIFRDLEHLEVG